MYASKQPRRSAWETVLKDPAYRKLFQALQECFDGEEDATEEVVANKVAELYRTKSNKYAHIFHFDGAESVLRMEVYRFNVVHGLTRPHMWFQGTPLDRCIIQKICDHLGVTMKVKDSNA